MKCQVMGIVNVTPDSFSDGGQFFRPEEAIRRARNLIAEGADIIDLGGESTRPGATPLGWEEEWRRLEPVISALSGKIPLSIDTYHPETAARAIAAGANIINCVKREAVAAMTELLRSGLLRGIAARNDGVGTSASPRNDGVGVSALSFVDSGTSSSFRNDGAGTSSSSLRGANGDEAIQNTAAIQLVIPYRLGEPLPPDLSRIYLDPMIGFDTTREEDVALLQSIPELAKLGRVLIGSSRKRIVKKLTGEKVTGKNLGGNLGIAVWAALKGASVVRVHDVKETVQALRVAAALEG